MLYDGINGTMTAKTANMLTKYAEALDIFGTYKGLFDCFYIDRIVKNYKRIKNQL